jgi:hypothetical protein
MIKDDAQFFAVDSALLSIIDTSGATSANTVVGYPAVLGFAGYTYWYSTGRIFSHFYDSRIPLNTISLNCRRDNSHST